MSNLKKQARKTIGVTVVINGRTYVVQTTSPNGHILKLHSVKKIQKTTP